MTQPAPLSLPSRRHRPRARKDTAPRWTFRRGPSLGDLICEIAEGLRPPERLTVAEAAATYRLLNNPGAYVGPWFNEETPYLVEPMNVVTDRHFDSGVFVGPAQSGKTEILLNAAAYTIRCDPMDMMIVQTSQVTARDFSRRRIDRMHRHSPEIGMRLLPTGDADNTFDKYYRSGMILSLSWPSINELSGKPIGRVFLTDYDRMPEDVDHEGSPFDLARKRTTTFGSSAMTFAESSPGFVVDDPRWLRRSLHEAPPCPGILALYNRGDRRRWVWPCPHCGMYFEPEFSLLQWRESADLMDAASTTQMMCPHCAALIPHRHKRAMNARGRWLREGQAIDPSGLITGRGVRSSTASFWLKGPAASFVTWQTLVERYLIALQEYDRTGSEEALKSTVNTDQGEVYYPRATLADRHPDALKEQAANLPEREVPDDARFLIATADVQKHKFVVQVFGISPGEPYRITVIDRFDIIKSKRLDDDGERHWVNPAAYLEDWRLLEDEVLAREYPLHDGSGVMGITFFGIDSGGREGVTTNAYDWWRSLRASGDHRRVFLIKGDPMPGAPRARISYPDSQRRDRKAGARGEIPVLLLNVNQLKDALAGLLERSDSPRFVWPDWLPDTWYQEMCAERRTAKGWENPRKARNEAWDLAGYCLGLLLHKKIDRLPWDHPPEFAAMRASNPRVRHTTATAEGLALASRLQYDIQELAHTLA